MATSITDKMERWARTLLPTPFTIAIILTLLTWVMAIGYTHSGNASLLQTTATVFSWWEQGLWTSSLLAFAVQMMLILVLGHTLALTPLAHVIIQKMTKYCTTTTSAVVYVSFLTMVVGLLNWGLGLVFGAIFARKVAEQAAKNGWSIHYGLVGAAGYSGMLVWHGGLSGSAPLKAAESGHIASFVPGYQGGAIPLTETLFSALNWSVTFAMLVCIPLLLFILAKKAAHTIPSHLKNGAPTELPGPPAIGAEKLDTSHILGKAIGLTILIYALAKPQITEATSFLSLLTPDFVNFLLLGCSLLLHQNIKSFLGALDEAIGGVSGILIQFPLYFGIIGVIKQSGLAADLALYFSMHSSPTSFPLFTFLSAALINIFVPSGGGQWTVQAPVLITTAQNMAIAPSKCIMAMSYGDQLTNMLQPFWALPLLGITGLKAKEILPYTIAMLLVATCIFGTAILVF